MISTILALTSLTLASISDLKEKHFKERKIPNAYFLPLPLLLYLNPTNILSTAILLLTGILLAKLNVFGYADTLALSTISATGPNYAVPIAMTGLYIATKKHPEKQKLPGLPYITAGYITALLISTLL